MPAEVCTEYDTIVVGAAYLVKGILQRLGFVSIVDEALQSQPVIETTYGNLAQIVVANRLTFQPLPLYHLGDWAAEHGMTHVFGIEAEWLDDDRMGALLEGLADHQVSIWSRLVENALRYYKIAPEFLHADMTSAGWLTNPGETPTSITTSPFWESLSMVSIWPWPTPKRQTKSRGSSSAATPPR